MGAISDFYANTGSTSWNLSSEKDPRWNCSGPGGEDAMWVKIRALEAEFGELPTDLKFSAFKD